MTKRPLQYTNLDAMVKLTLTSKWLNVWVKCQLLLICSERVKQYFCDFLNCFTKVHSLHSAYQIHI